MTIERLKQIEASLSTLGFHATPDSMPFNPNPAKRSRENEVYFDLALDLAIKELKKFEGRENVRTEVRAEQDPYCDSYSPRFVVLWDEVETEAEAKKRQQQERESAHWRWKNSYSALTTERDRILTEMAGNDEHARFELLAAARGYKLVKE